MYLQCKKSTSINIWPRLAPHVTSDSTKIDALGCLVTSLGLGIDVDRCLPLIIAPSDLEVGADQYVLALLLNGFYYSPRFSLT